MSLKLHVRVTMEIMYEQRDVKPRGEFACGLIAIDKSIGVHRWCAMGIEDKQMQLGVQLGRVRPGWRSTQAQPAKKKKIGFGLGPTRIDTRCTQPELNPSRVRVGPNWCQVGWVRVGLRFARGPKIVNFVKICENCQNVIKVCLRIENFHLSSNQSCQNWTWKLSKLKFYQKLVRAS